MILDMSPATVSLVGVILPVGIIIEDATGFQKEDKP